MRPIASVALFVLVLLLSLTATVFAAGAIDPAGADPGLLELVKPVVSAVLAGQWFLGGSLGLVLLVGLAAKYGKKRFPFLGTGAGKASLLLVGAFGGTLSAAAATGAAFTLAIVWTALKVAFSTAGGFTVVRALFGPLVAKAPAWMRAPLDLILWFFDHKADPVVERAEEAGAAAVEAKPSNGAAGVVGKPTDVA